MSTGWKFAKGVGVVVLCAGLSFAAETTHVQRKSAKKPQLPPLPSGPTGPVPQIPLDSMKPVAPQVSYQNGQLTIVAPNSTLADILRAVKRQTGADIEIPDAPERVVTHVGPGSPRDVMAELLNGSRFNYVLLGSPEDASVLTRVVLVAKTPDKPNNPQGQQVAAQPQQPPQEVAQDANDADQPDENADDNAGEQPAVEQPLPEQPAQQPDGLANGPKTPQQLLQEMQQRQLQLQNTQPPGMPPIPGQGGALPPGAPQPQQPEPHER